VDEHIKRHVPKVKSYVRDTQDCIAKIRAAPPLPEGAYLVTMDIVSLYTNIPNHGALIAIADHLRADPEMYQIGPYILRLAEVCLHNTNFIFNREHYMQIGGTSMGNPFCLRFHQPNHGPSDLSFTIIEDCNLLKPSNDPDKTQK
jgi:hypothetical protein